MEFGEHIFTIISIGLAILAALFTYYNFFREGKHRQRIEFDIDFKNLGVHKRYRIIEIGAIGENKGNIEQRFESIRLRVRGLIDEIELAEVKNYEPRLFFPKEAFPEEKRKIELIPKHKNSDNYYFIRPGVRQRFPIVLKIPKEWTILFARVTFNYKGTNEIHNAERAFRIKGDD